MSQSMLVVSAHAVDFVWRAGGTIAKYSRAGWDVNVIVMSLGARGESASLWRDPGQTYENVEEVRRAESVQAAEILGCKLHFLNLKDYRLVVTSDVMDGLVQLFRRFRPSIIVTHGEKDPFNPDHPLTHQAVVEARLLAGASGVFPDTDALPPTRLFGFEPHQTELSEFVPEIFIDITDEMDTKLQAMKCIPTQAYLSEFHLRLAESRAYHARRNSSNASVEFAEAFQSYVPIVGDWLP